jgi:hypothetical protein
MLDCAYVLYISRLDIPDINYTVRGHLQFIYPSWSLPNGWQFTRCLLKQLEYLIINEVNYFDIVSLDSLHYLASTRIAKDLIVE